jgi:hypothetical protein
MNWGYLKLFKAGTKFYPDLCLSDCREPGLNIRHLQGLQIMNINDVNGDDFLRMVSLTTLSTAER